MNTIEPSAENYPNESHAQSFIDQINDAIRRLSDPDGRLAARKLLDELDTVAFKTRARCMGRPLSALDFHLLNRIDETRSKIVEALLDNWSSDLPTLFFEQP